MRAAGPPADRARRAAGERELAQRRADFWDTHGNNFNRLKNDLIPPADRALAALLTDLSDRGLLDDTIVAWVGEFGRKPEISNGHGREHWPYCYSGLLAGGGIAGGAVYGASDKHAAYPATNPSARTTMPPRCCTPWASRTTRCCTTPRAARTRSMRANRQRGCLPSGAGCPASVGRKSRELVATSGILV